LSYSQPQDPIGQFNVSWTALLCTMAKVMFVSERDVLQLC